ncbi:biotin transporter BioY [Paracoccus litorisediminis]|jgi:biotin transport system substrate-specific component|uniref:Biotin transporter n=1 Tax=Paracoccus litorisediminis TaxID=2006130 RepID=A0A844HGV3_9RHOB|nr:biotin transporter BioY [Paracoccus litorisediminis]MTH59080.1 BioY family transporter [Paracoccus litorisediminis]
MERNVAQIALFAALIAALGLVPKITLAFGVPITAQGMGIMLAGAMLGAKRGFLSVMLFLLLVAIGLPLLAGGRGGLAVFAGPTAGFLVGFPIAAFVTGWFVEHARLRHVGLRAFIGAVLGGVVVLYAFGIVGMSLSLGKSISECTMLMAIFIPGDLLKAAITGMLVAAIAKARPRALGWTANA